VSVLRRIRSALVTAVLAPTRLFVRLRGRRVSPGSRRILVAFTRGHLEQTVLDAAIRIARAEEATLVPAYLIVIPMQFTLDAPIVRISIGPSDATAPRMPSTYAFARACRILTLSSSV